MQIVDCTSTATPPLDTREAPVMKRTAAHGPPWPRGWLQPETSAPLAIVRIGEPETLTRVEGAIGRAVPPCGHSRIAV